MNILRILLVNVDKSCIDEVLDFYLSMATTL